MSYVQLSSDPVYQLPHLYISGLNISYASTTVIAIAPGQARDATNNIDMPVSFANLQGVINPPLLLSSGTQALNINQAENGVNGFPGTTTGLQQPLYVNSSVNGANGLDTGAIAASTQYAIYLIADSRGYNNVAAVLSLTSQPGPVLPQGYDSFRLLGFAETDGSNHFVYATHKPQNMVGALSYYLSPATSVLSGGNATSFTAIDMSTPIPTTTLPNVIVYLVVTFIPSAAGDILSLRPTGSSATSNITTVSGIAAGVAQTNYITMIAGVGSSKPEIDYEVTVSGDSASISVLGWTGVSNTAYPALV